MFFSFFLLDVVHQSMSDNIVFFGHDDGSKLSIHSLRNRKPVDENQLCKWIDPSLKTVKDFRQISQEYNQDYKFTRFPAKLYSQEGTTQLFGDMIEDIHRPRNYRILTGYNVFYHLEVLGFQEKDFEEYDINKHVTCDNVVTVLIPHSSLIIVGIVVDGNNAEDIKTEMKKCNDILKAIYILGQNNLAQKYMAVIGTMMLSNVSRKQLHEPHFFFLNKLEDYDEILFITKDEVESEENRKSIWWRKICLAVRNIIVPTSFDEKTRVQAIRDMASEMMVTMNDDMSMNYIYLPKARNIYNMMPLNNEQVDVIQDAALWKVISSDYGCGKSICLKKIAHHLSNKNDGSNIYYICFDPYSLMEVHVEEYFRKVLKREQVQSLSLKEITKDAGCTVADIYAISRTPSKNIAYLLEDLQKKNGKCHFLIDEMYIHNLDNNYCQQLMNSLKQHFNESSIVIASQSIETVHTFYVKDKEQDSEHSNLKTAGFKWLRLKRCMRMTSNLFQLANVARDIIKNTTTFIPLETKPRLRNKVVPCLSKVLKPKKEKVNANTHGTSLNSSIISNATTPSFSSLSTTTTTTTRENSGIVKNHHMTVDVSNSDDLSMLAKQFPDVLPKKNHKIVKKVGVKPEFVKGKCGNKTQSNSLPQLIYLDKNFSFESKVSANVLAIILKSLCLKNDHRTTFICSNLNEVVFTNLALRTANCQPIEYAPYLRGTLPSREQKYNIIKQLNNEFNNLLVTDYRAFRGCESDHCILFIDPSEKYANHTLVEVMTRAISKLDIFVYPSTKPTKSVLAKIFEAWDETIILTRRVKIKKQSNDKYTVMIGDKDIGVAEVNEEQRDVPTEIKHAMHDENHDHSKSLFG